MQFKKPGVVNIVDEICRRNNIVLSYAEHDAMYFMRLEESEVMIILHYELRKAQRTAENKLYAAERSYAKRDDTESFRKLEEAKANYGYIQDLRLV